MLVLIPSRSRPGRQPTAAALAAAGVPYGFVCNADDPALPGYRALGQPVYVAYTDTLSPGTCNAMLTIADPSAGYSADGKVIMMDDDLTLYERLPGGNWIKATPVGVGRMVAWFLDALEDAAHASIVNRFMCHTRPRGTLRYERYNGILAYNTQLFKDPAPRFRLRFSFEHDMNFQLIAAGQYPLVSCEWAMQAQQHQPGGCMDYRTEAMDAEGIDQLCATWPRWTTKVPKPGKFGGATFRVSWANVRKDIGPAL